MGALLAIPPWIDLDSLSFETQPARILAEAMRDYGAYLVDNTAWDVYAFITEWSPEGRFTDQFRSDWGFPFKEGSKNTPWGRDMDRIFLNLHVVDNNAASSIGGGGEPRADPAPEFYPTSRLTVQADGTGGAIASPEGSFEASRWIETRIAAYTTDPQACTFSHWSLLEGSATIFDTASPSTSVILDSTDAVVRANFVMKSYTLTTAEGDNGTIGQDPVLETYPFGTEVTLTAIPAEGYQFAGWSGDRTGTENPLVVTITGDTHITAGFTRIYYNLVAGSASQGSVTTEPAGDSLPSGTQVTLTAIPDTGWVFRNWTGDLTSEENPLSLTMNRDWIVYASYDQVATSIGQPGEHAEDDAGSTVQMIQLPAEQALLFRFPAGKMSGRIHILDVNGRIVSVIPTGGGERSV